MNSGTAVPMASGSPEKATLPNVEEMLAIIPNQTRSTNRIRRESCFLRLSDERSSLKLDALLSVASRASFDSLRSDEWVVVSVRLWY